MDVDIAIFLHTLLDSWKDKCPHDQRLHTAALKALHNDAAEALQLAPTEIRGILPTDFQYTRQLCDMVHDTRMFLKSGIVKYCARRNMGSTPVVSPLLAGSRQKTPFAALMSLTLLET